MTDCAVGSVSAGRDGSGAPAADGCLRAATLWSGGKTVPAQVGGVIAHRGRQGLEGRGDSGVGSIGACLGWDGNGLTTKSSRLRQWLKL